LVVVHVCSPIPSASADPWLRSPGSG